MIDPKNIELVTTKDFVLYENEDLIGYNRDVFNKLDLKNRKFYLEKPDIFKELSIKKNYLNRYFPILPEILGINEFYKNLISENFIDDKIKIDNRLFLKYNPIFDSKKFYALNEIFIKFNLYKEISLQDNILSISDAPFLFELLYYNNIKSHRNYFIKIDKSTTKFYIKNNILLKETNNKNIIHTFHTNNDSDLKRNNEFLEKYPNRTIYLFFNEKIYELLNLKDIPKQKIIYVHYFKFVDELSFCANTFLQFYWITFFIFAIEHLEKGGVFMIFIRLLTKKFIMDLYAIMKLFFKETSIYTPDILNDLQGANYLVFRNFNGLNSNNKVYLTKLKEQLEKIKELYPNEVDDFNIYEKKWRDKLNIKKEIKGKRKPYLDSLLNIKLEERQLLYNDFINFNRLNNQYRLNLFYKKFELLNVPLNSLPKLPTIEQINNSLLYCRKWNIDYYEYFDKNKLFLNKIGKNVLNDFYGLNQPIIFEFKTNQQYYSIDVIQSQKSIISLKGSSYTINKKNNSIKKTKKLKLKSIKRHENIKEAINYYESLDYYNIKDFLNLIDENNIKRENNKVINTILYDILLEDNTKYYKINYDYESRLSIINANIYFNKIRKNFDFYNNNKINKYSIPYFLSNIIKNNNIDLKWSILFEILNETNILNNETQTFLMLSKDYLGELDCLKYFIKNKSFSYLTYDDLDKSKNIIQHILSLNSTYSYLHEDNNNNNNNNNNKGLIIDTNNPDKNLDVFIRFFTVLYNLLPGDSMIFKLSLPLDNKPILNLLYLSYYNFEKLIVYKPILENNTKYFYLVGIGYNTINTGLLEQLLHTINDIKNGDIDFEELDLFNDIYPEAFGIQLGELNKILVNKYHTYLEKQIFYYDNYKHISKNINELVSDHIKEKNLEWINRYKFRKI
tara:strand:- start:1241 stop:3949 length:2709 start_codon:yes stop_codon:yes gene_type:complete